VSKKSKKIQEFSFKSQMAPVQAAGLVSDLAKGIAGGKISLYAEEQGIALSTPAATKISLGAETGKKRCVSLSLKFHSKPGE